MLSRSGREASAGDEFGQDDVGGCRQSDGQGLMRSMTGCGGAKECREHPPDTIHHRH